MKAPYQIIRKESPSVRGQYLFALVDTRVPDPGEFDHRVVTTARGNSPIAPEYLRKRQGVLNTRAILD